MTDRGELTVLAAAPLPEIMERTGGPDGQGSEEKQSRGQEAQGREEEGRPSDVTLPDGATYVAIQDEARARIAGR